LTRLNKQEKNLQPNIKSVTPHPGNKLLLVYENGERRIFNVTPWLKKGIFKELADEKMFKTVRVSFDAVEWANGADICPEDLYLDSIPLESTHGGEMMVADPGREYQRVVKNPKLRKG
jgi:hypothetical protein